MSMQRVESDIRPFQKDPNPEKAELAGKISNGLETWRKLYGDFPLSSVVTPAEKQTVRIPEIKILSPDQLVLPYTELPREVSGILQRAEKAGITSLEPYHLSNVTLNKDSSVEGWDKKPANWFWEQIRNGKVNQDAAKLPGSWVLIDKTARPGYKDGKQLHENDPFGPLLAKLRKEGKIKVPKELKHIPQTSRFGVSPDELTQVVLPEIAKLLGVEASVVRLPKEIEFNLIGNLSHPEWGQTNTSEWFNDKFGDDRRLLGGFSVLGGLADVGYHWSGDHFDDMAFRPLVVVSPKA